MLSQISSFTLVLADPPIQPEFDNLAAEDIIFSQCCMLAELNLFRRSMETSGEWMIMVIITTFYHSVSPTRFIKHILMLNLR